MLSPAHQEEMDAQGPTIRKDSFRHITPSHPTYINESGLCLSECAQG